mmetsp:Transcript_3833/g.8641  ORF Transcript_3833/g.8641 Transcript_3833/m.8641 type:complete len:202 (+) Transcript_3833:2950-3555(+)
MGGRGLDRGRPLLLVLLLPVAAARAEAAAAAAAVAAAAAEPDPRLPNLAGFGQGPPASASEALALALAFALAAAASALDGVVALFCSSLAALSSSMILERTPPVLGENSGLPSLPRGFSLPLPSLPLLPPSPLPRTCLSKEAARFFLRPRAAAKLNSSASAPWLKVSPTSSVIIMVQSAGFSMDPPPVRSRSRPSLLLLSL